MPMELISFVPIVLNMEDEASQTPERIYILNQNIQMIAANLIAIVQLT